MKLRENRSQLIFLILIKELQTHSVGPQHSGGGSLVSGSLLAPLSSQLAALDYTEEKEDKPNEGESDTDRNDVFP